MTRPTVVVAIALGSAMALTAQDRFGFGRQDWCADSYGSRQPWHCTVREATLPASQRALDVDPGGNGGIAVRGWNGAETRLRARVSASAPGDARAREIVEAVRIETAGGRIRAAGPDTGGREHWNVSFELEVPHDTTLRLAAHNGGIAISEFRGVAGFRTVNGGISLREVAGDIRGRTSNGGVTVDLSGTRWEGAGLDVETQNGGVRLRIPDGYSAELETGTTNGGMTIDFPITASGNLRRFPRTITTRLGSGGPRIRVMTTNGGVTITRR